MKENENCTQNMKRTNSKKLHKDTVNICILTVFAREIR